MSSEPTESGGKTPPESEASQQGSPETEAASADPGATEVVDDTPTEGDEEAGAEVSALEALETQVATLEQEKKDTYERLLRATADLDNLRKRSRREIADARIEARAQVLRDVLPVVDNLERALAHADTSAESIVDGVKLVMRQFETALEKSQVKMIEAEGVAFDPNLHEAMSQIESADAEPGSVVQVLQAGYTIGERLLRPALVVVAKAPSNEEPAAGANGKSALAEGEGEGDGGDGAAAEDAGGDDES